MGAIGFNSDIISRNTKEVDELFKLAMPKDLTKFGLIPEFIGRLPVQVSLNMLDEEALVNILTKPRNALIKQYKKLLELDEVKLEFSDEAIRELARQALEQKTGARGLRSIIEKVMMNMMYEVPSDDNISTCKISLDTIKSGEYELLYRDNTKGIKKLD